jgi:hypothetical protein
VSLIDIARRQLEEDAESRLLERIAEEVTAGRATWRDDPVVPGVVGLVKAGTNEALVVVYVNDRDFEVADELLS